MDEQAGVNFNKMPMTYWAERTKASYLQRMVLLYNIMYHRLGGSCVSDEFYNTIAKQLAEMQASMSKEELKRTDYFYIMANFDGYKGYSLCYKLNPRDERRLVAMATTILNKWRGENQNEQGK